jgi:alpha-glucosidase
VANVKRFWAAVITLLLARPAAAGWTSVGAVAPPQREGQTLLFEGPQGRVILSVLAPDLVRVRFAPGPLGRDHSYAVVGRGPGDPRASFDVSPERTIVATVALKITVRHDPFRITFADAAGTSLDEDDPERGMAASGAAVRVWKRLREDEHVYGLGEKAGSLDKRGNHLGGTSYAMWNTDAYGYDAGTDPLYVAVPFFLVLRGGAAHGVFFDNTFRSSFDVGKESPGLLSFGAEGGELDYYFIQGPSPRRVLERFADLTGHMPLPPRWSLGFHQSRWGYYPESRVRFIADNFRQRRIPADTLWLDIDYLDDHKPFTWDRERFPDPKRLMADLRAQGFRIVTIVDPHLKKERGYAPYEAGLAGDHFVKNPDGSLYEGRVWPGVSVFPDFSRPATRDWWAGLYAPLVEAGVAGIWNDMNEPAVFDVPSGTMPLSVRHDNEGRPSDHREIHNVYGMLMSRATHEGLRRLRPSARPFILSRASFAGGQRYAALWPGDNTANWPHLRMTIPLFAGMGLSGLPFVGADIGGYAGRPSAELFTRWLQLGVFYPFMRAHSETGMPDKEPWSFGARHEASNRRAIELRYELLPEIYNVLEEASRTGMPAFRPLFLESPEDPETYGLEDEFLFGADLLVAPVVVEAATQRALYLPKGDWYDFWTGRLFAGGKRIDVPVDLDAIPIFARAGAFVFRQPVVQHTGEMPGQPLEVEVFPAAQSNASLYEDEGEGFDYQKGAFARRRFEQRRVAGACTITVSAPEGSYRWPSRSLVLRVHSEGQPRRVAAGAQLLPRLAPEKWSAEARGWMPAEGGLVLVKLPDAASALQVRIE